MPFITRPNFEDRQVVQYSGDTITLSGGTNINNLGSLQINAPILDFTGTTTASTIYNIAGVQGYVNYGQPSSFIIQPPIILQSGTTGTTTVDVTGYILGGMDSMGHVTWFPASYFLTGGTNTVSGGTDFYVTGGTFDNLTGVLTLDRQNGSVTIPGFCTGCTSTDFYVTGGTYSSGVLTLDRQNGSVIITGFDIPSGGTITSGPYIYGTGAGSIIPLSGNNTSESTGGIVLGGANNEISGTTNLSLTATIVNGNSNYIYRNRYAFIGGGITNSIIRDIGFATHNTIVNGNSNSIYHPQEGGNNFIGNGLENAISGTNITYSFIGNGQRNLIRTTTTGSDSAAILNGTDNIIGYGTSPYGLILNGSSNSIGSTRYSTVVNGDGNVVGPNVGHSTIISGKDNRIFNPGSSPLTLTYDLIGDGSGNTINIATYSSITNGRGNSVDFAAGSSILNGGFNLISYSDISTTINGVYNIIDNADYSTIINGTYNVISGFTGSTIIGGNNIIADDNNTVYVPKLTAGIPTYTPNETSVFKVNERNAFGRIRPNYISDLIWSGNTTGTTFDIPIPAGWVVEDVSIYVKSNDTNVQMSTISTTGGVWGSTTYTMFIPPLIHNIFTYMNITSNGPNYFTSPDTLSVGFYDAFGIPATPTNGLFYIMIRYWDGNELF
jgi:hypothetical protein